MHGYVYIFGHRVFLSKKLLHKLILLLFLLVSLLLHPHRIHILFFPLLHFSLLSVTRGFLRDSVLAGYPEVEVVWVTRGDEGVRVSERGQGGVAGVLEDEVGVGQCEIVVIISCVFTGGWGDGTEVGKTYIVRGAVAHAWEVAERM
jgi:hypothetical protein